MNFSFSTEPYLHYQVIYLKGRLDGDSYDLLDQTMARALKKADHLVLDFKELTYISSVGIGLLLKYSPEVEKQGGKIWLTGLGGETLYLVEKLGLAKKFHIEKSKKKLPETPD